jgi:hypothetical protein
MRGRKTREAAGKAFDRVIYVSHAHNHKYIKNLPFTHQLFSSIHHQQPPFWSLLLAC